MNPFKRMLTPEQCERVLGPALRGDLAAQYELYRLVDDGMRREHREQVLVDMLFATAIMAQAGELRFADRESAAEWVRQQLKAFGIETEPRGSSWGVIVRSA